MVRALGADAFPVAHAYLALAIAVAALPPRLAALYLNGLLALGGRMARLAREAQVEVRTLHHGLARKFINKQVGRIKRMFAWAVEEELLPVSVHQALLRVKGLKKGKSQAREKPAVRPVPDAFVEAVLPHVPAGSQQ